MWALQSLTTQPSLPFFSLDAASGASRGDAAPHGGYRAGACEGRGGTGEAESDRAITRTEGTPKGVWTDLVSDPRLPRSHWHGSSTQAQTIPSSCCLRTP